MSVQEFWYKGVNVILQVFGDDRFCFRGVLFFDTDSGVTTERVLSDAVYPTKDEAFQSGFEHVKKFVDENLTLN